MNNNSGRDDRHISFRASPELVRFYDNLQEEWEDLDKIDNRSDVIRTVSKAFVGLLEGRLIGLVNLQKLKSEGGDFGKLLAGAIEGPEDIPEDISDLRLSDVIDEPMLLVGAAESELEGVDLKNGKRT